MSQNTKIILAALLLLCGMGYLAYSLMTSVAGSPKPSLAGESRAINEEAPKAAALVTDPFFHPAVQQVLPASSTSEFLKGAIQPQAAQNEPLRPIVQGPIAVLPGQTRQPDPLPGQFPSRAAAAPAPPVPPAAEAVTPVKISLQGLVVGDKPAAFVRVNDSASQKVVAGSTLMDGITVLEISEKHMTVSRKGRTLKLTPGQSENL